MCHAETLITLFSSAVEYLAREEFDSYIQVSDAEWEIIKTTRAGRSLDITSNIRVRNTN